jgi:polyhydroxybutyrate depolymerase
MIARGAGSSPGHRAEETVPRRAGRRHKRGIALPMGDRPPREEVTRCDGGGATWPVRSRGRDRSDPDRAGALRLVADHAGMIPVGSATIPLTHDGRDRPYILHVPPATIPAGLPLVLELHGRGIDAELFDRLTGFRRLADEAGFVVALPSAAGETWNDGRGLSRAATDDVGYLGAVIDDAVARAPIDRRRIYVVGMSNGATMAGRLAWELPGRFAAIAQVAGMAAVTVVAGGPAGGPLPILEIHGSADRYARYDGEPPRGPLTRAVLRRPAGRSVGVEAWARLWLARNGAKGAPIVESIPPDTTIRRWNGESPASDVVFYRVEGAGHTWPGAAFPLPRLLFGPTCHTFSATEVSWAFLSAHVREEA